MLHALRNELADLYTDTNSARRVLGDAGIDVAKLGFDGPIINVWWQAIEEADKQRKLPDLVAVALIGYPQSFVLRQVADALQRASQPNRSEGFAPMSSGWGGSEYAIRLEGRMTAIETNLPSLKADVERQFRQVGENQAANRKWTEEQFAENRAWTEKQFADLTTLIKTMPAQQPEPQDGRTFRAVMATGAVATAILLILIAFGIVWWTGRDADDRGNPGLDTDRTEYNWSDPGKHRGDLLRVDVAGEPACVCAVGAGYVAGPDPALHPAHHRRDRASCAATNNHRCSESGDQRGVALVGVDLVGGSFAPPGDGDPRQPDQA
jgi:hypothetical protein